MSTTQQATGTPEPNLLLTFKDIRAAATPVSRTVLVEALHHIARLVEQGIPAPTAVVADTAGEVAVHVRPDDVPAWVIALDLPAPHWDTQTVEDRWVYRTGVWPETAFLELLFRIYSADRVPVCAEHADLDPTLCPPACWASDYSIGGA